jgi:hypothetical protein
MPPRRGRVVGAVQQAVAIAQGAAGTQAPAPAQPSSRI